MLLQCWQHVCDTGVVLTQGIVAGLFGPDGNSKILVACRGLSIRYNELMPGDVANRFPGIFNFRNTAQVNSERPGGFARFGLNEKISPADIKPVDSTDAKC